VFYQQERSSDFPLTIFSCLQDEHKNEMGKESGEKLKKMKVELDKGM
jgi:hypothetical protein